MSDRWQTELQKLRRLDPPPDDLWERKRGNQGHRPAEASGPKKLLIITASLAIGLGGVGLAGYSFLSRDSAPRVATATSPAMSHSGITFTQARQVPLAASHGITAGDGSIWIGTLNEGQGSDDPSVTRIDPTTGATVATISTATVPTTMTGPTGMAYADGTLWVTGAGERSSGPHGAILTGIDAATNTVTSEVSLDGQEGVDVAANGSDVWVLVRGDADALTVVKVDAASGVVEDVTSIGDGSPRHLVSTGADLIVTAFATNGDTVGNGTVVTSVDASTMQITAQASDEHLLFGLATSPDGEVWAAFDGGLEQISPTTARSVGSGVPIDIGIDGLVTSSDGVWFFGPGDSTAESGLFNPSTGVLFGPAAVPVQQAVDIVATGDTLWVGSDHDLVSLNVATDG